MNKKFLIFSIILVLIILIIIVIFIFAGKDKKESEISTTRISEGIINQTEESEIVPKDGRLKMISEDSVFKVLVYDDDLLIFTPSGEILQSNFEGEGVKKLRESNGELIRAIVSNNNSHAILTEIDIDGEITQTVINLNSFKEFKLLPNVFSPVFSPQGDKIAYNYYDKSSDVNNISIANLDGGNIETIFNLNIYNIDLSWSEGNLIYIFKPASYLVESHFYLLDIIKKELRVSDISARGLVVKGLNNGLLYSTVSNQGKDLKLYFSDADNSLEIPFKTISHKCQFTDGVILICAEPLNINSKILPDDYFKRKFYSIDKFVKFNLFDKTIEKIADFNDLDKTGIDAIGLTVTEKFLFIIDRKDNKLYRLTL